MKRDSCVSQCSEPAGMRRHRVILQKRAAGVDADGNSSGAWTKVAAMRASIEPLRARELFQAQQVSSKVTHRIGINYRAGVTSSMRFLFGARVFDIDGIINPMEANRTLEILAQEKA